MNITGRGSPGIISPLLLVGRGGQPPKKVQTMSVPESICQTLTQNSASSQCSPSFGCSWPAGREQKGPMPCSFPLGEATGGHLVPSGNQKAPSVPGPPG